MKHVCTFGGSWSVSSAFFSAHLSALNFSKANWVNRTEIVNYCVAVVDKSMDAKREAIAGQDPRLDENRQTASSLYTDEVKRNQMRNELTVEAIIRQRSLDAFKSRCKYFEPPPSDARSRQWWDTAHSGR
ncbi:hypothetical protein FRC08_010608 [Ceratobasidium sp. 394]|nr:hypothetical protein FRC08_010608 [Ceratobasidium sp. 394]